MISKYRMIPRSSLSMYPKSHWVYAACSYYSSKFEQSMVAVIGSSDPWVEAIAIALNARMITSIEYNHLTYENPKISSVSELDFEKFYEESQNKFDIVFSISAFDHSGLVIKYQILVQIILLINFEFLFYN